MYLVISSYVIYPGLYTGVFFKQLRHDRKSGVRVNLDSLIQLDSPKYIQTVPTEVLVNLT